MVGYPCRNRLLVFYTLSPIISVTPKQIWIGDHARKRFRARNITRQEIRWLIARGIRSTEPTLSGAPQRWSCRGYLGREEAKVVFIEDAVAITLVTAEW